MSQRNRYQKDSFMNNFVTTINQNNYERSWTKN